MRAARSRPRSPSIVVADSIFRSEEVVGLSAHSGVVDTRQFTMPFDELFCGTAALSADRPDLGNLDAIAGYAEGFPGLDRIHHRR
jgi:hypothetical protein